MWWQWSPLHIQRNGFYMSIEKANTHISSCLYYLSRELDPLLTELLAQKEFMPQKVLEERGWTIILKIHDENRDRLRHPDLYNPKDLQVQLRMFTEGVGPQNDRFPFEPDGARKVRTYAQDLRIFRNKSAHYVDLDRNDAVRIYDSAARLFEALGASEQQAWCEGQLNRVHADLFGAGEAAPVRRELDEEVRQAASTAREVKTEVSAPRGAFTRPARPAPVPRPAQPAPAASTAQPAPVSDSSVLSCASRWGRAVTRLSRGSRFRWVTVTFLIRCAASVLRSRCLLLLKRLCLLRVRFRLIVWRLWRRSALV